MRPTFTTGLEPPQGQHDRHLQEDAEEVADVVRAMLGEAFGAVTALEQKTAALADIRQLFLERPRLACENQRRIGAQTGLDLVQNLLVRIGRDLQDWLRSPAVRCPHLCHGTYSQLLSGSRNGERLYRYRPGRRAPIGESNHRFQPVMTARPVRSGEFAVFHTMRGQRIVEQRGLFFL
jgi:hypothetical protein